MCTYRCRLGILQSVCFVCSWVDIENMEISVRFSKLIRELRRVLQEWLDGVSASSSSMKREINILDILLTKEDVPSALKISFTITLCIRGLIPPSITGNIWFKQLQFFCLHCVNILKVNQYLDFVTGLDFQRARIFVDEHFLSTGGIFVVCTTTFFFVVVLQNKFKLSVLHD